jgi:hypothetical protein
MGKIDVLAKIIKEAKITSKAFKDQNGNSSLRISNKDLLIWLAGKQVEQDEKINKNSTRINMLIVFTPIVITVLAILL